MKRILLVLCLCITGIAVSAQKNSAKQRKSETKQQNLSLLAYQTENTANKRMQQQQQARRVRGTVFIGQNQQQIFLYVVYDNKGAYVTSYSTGQRDMNGREITNSVQSYAQRVSFQYDGDLSQYYDWKISIGNQSTGYQACYF